MIESILGYSIPALLLGGAGYFVYARFLKDRGSSNQLTWASKVGSLRPKTKKAADIWNKALPSDKKLKESKDFGKAKVQVVYGEQSGKRLASYNSGNKKIYVSKEKWKKASGAEQLYIMTHELGHYLGLHHKGSKSADIMSETLPQLSSENQVKLTDNDKKRLRKIYS